ncbi:hypothetical protein NGA_0452400 [Nannochloropsis gaditana CCMP526]|nr:hypothetical protein NGA_0452400 [Nannochloropsis gaditana CCMP526]EKU22489.1 hypothetical protein NGA_0452400 [Nannochloropsis gaditana CCMP526]|eukprot:XP_005853868.1 hypothetical protein NGA_0452400 [Nannochloropsis gaditana CCMP526]
MNLLQGFPSVPRLARATLE